MIPPHPAKFFMALRSGLLGPKLSPEEVAGCQAILDACKAWPVSWTAYALATAYHETAHTMQPIREWGTDTYFTRMYDPKGFRPEVARELGNTKPGDGVKFCGRGFVQITGRRNYTRFGCDANPDAALDPQTAADILEKGMRLGLFTGKKLSDYLEPTGKGSLGRFTAARRIINGVDRAGLIAGYAMQFQDALIEGGCAL